MNKYFQIFMNLCLVVLLIALYMFITWKVKSHKKGKGKLLEILSILHVGTKEKIMIIRAEDKRFLLGVTSTNVTKLSSLSDEAEFDLENFVNCHDKITQEAST